MSSHAPAQRATSRPLLTLLSGNGAVALLTLMRNLFAARLIGLEDFGIAASFAILVSAVEMFTTLGAQQLIVQDKDGDSEELLAALHMVQLIRGLGGAACLYVLAEPVAKFLGTPEVAWAYRTLCLVPLMLGFVHLDAWRYQRVHRFGPTICTQLGPALLALSLIWPLYVKFGDFRVLLIASLAHAAGVLVMSRLVAERRFALSWARARLAQTVRFGWPLAVNGILLFAVFHGEKLLVGHLRGPEALAILAIGFTLTLTPALVLGRSLQSYALPLLASAPPREFDQTAQRIMVLSLTAGVGLAMLLFVGAPLVVVMIGKAFAPVTALVPALCILHGLRVVRTGTSVIALAKGATGNAVIGNMPRVLVLPMGYLMLVDGASLSALLWLATAAEGVGLALAYLALVRNRRAPPKDGART